MRIKSTIYQLVASVTLFAAPSVFGQTESEGSMVLQSPQVWNFIKYGDQGSVDMYTGSLAVSIPLYTYKDEDFEIPVSVNYGSNGYKPNIQTGILGLGWFLNAGGCITREVRDLPDDTSKTIVSGSYPVQACNIHQGGGSGSGGGMPLCACAFMGNGYNFRGYLEYYEVAGNGSDYTLCPQINLPFAAFKRYAQIPYPGGTVYETLSDVYHFQFGKHKGSFCFDVNTHSIHVFNSSQPYGQYKISYAKYPNGQFYKFTIITGDGFKYTFGGDFQQRLDYTDYNYNEPGHPRVDYHLTWMLKEIEAPNKRKVVFNYYEPEKFDVERPIAWTNQDNRPSPSAPEEEEGAVRSLIVKYAQTGINLREIVIDDKVAITFDIGSKLSESSYISGSIRNLGQIDSIEVKTIGANPRIIKKGVFTYYNSNNSSNKIQFLRSLNVSGEGEYVFSYYDENAQYPKHGTSALDHWGYYNRKESYNPSYLLPLVGTDADYNELILSDNKEPDSIGSRMGMLARIQYPTGGATRYEYNGNTYTRKVIRNFTTFCLPQLGSAGVGGYNYAGKTEYPAGGVRVEAIIDSMSGTENRVRQYRYENTDRTGSGILLNYPRYKTTIRLSVGSYVKNYKIIDYRYGGLVNYTIDNTHISYPSVREYCSGSSYTDYQFINYEDVPDGFGAGAEYGMIGDGQVTITGLVGGDALFIESSSNHIVRGKMKAKFLYNQMNKLVQKQLYTYNDGSGTLSGLKHTLSNFYAYNTVLYNCQLIGVETITYNESGAVARSVKYNYNVHGQLSAEESSDGVSTSETRIIYPGAYYVPNSYNAQYSYKYMLANNFLNFPLLRYSISNGKINNITKYEYYPDGINAELCVKRKSISKSSFAVPIDIATPYNDNWFSPEVNFDAYDDMGRLLQTTDKGGLQTVYLWGYGGQCPIAKIENSNIDAVKRINGFSDIEHSAFPAGLGGLETGLRTRLADSYITTYEWIPTVGMTKMTNPSGVITSYEYDEHGRLLGIYDDKNAAVQNFEYSQK